MVFERVKFTPQVGVEWLIHAIEGRESFRVDNVVKDMIDHFLSS